MIAAAPSPSMRISPIDRFGPWFEQIDEPERRARLRSLRAIVRLATGPRGERLADLLRQAEQDDEALAPALAALNALAPLDRRQGSPASPPSTAQPERSAMPMHSTLSPIETATKSIDALLAAMESATTAGAANAYRAAITRHGRNLVDTVGIEALPAVLARIRADAPDKASAETRAAIVLAAWEGFAKETRAA